MKQYMVIAIDTNLTSNPEEITRLHLDEAWRGFNIHDLEKRIRDHLYPRFDEYYTDCVLSWLIENPSKPLQVEGYVWFFAAIDL